MKFSVLQRCSFSIGNVHSIDKIITKRQGIYLIRIPKLDFSHLKIN
jgi:hypothetical protein